MVKILYIFRSLAIWGGIERVLIDKMNYLSNHGFEVYMLTTCQGTHPIPFHLDKKIHMGDLGIQFHQQYRYHGVRRLWEDFRRIKLFEKRLLERINVIQPNIIICTTTDPVFSIAKIKGDIPLIVESHNICIRALGEKGFHQRIIAWRLKKGLRKTACLVALTESDADRWKGKELLNSIETIPDVVQLNDRGKANLQNRKVVWVGRFDYQKHPIEMVKIWQIVQQRNPRWELHFYGDGELRNEIERLSNKLHLNVYFHNASDRIFDIYRDSSLLVLTSLFEPFGLVLPEAMSCGLPVVAFDCPYGPMEIITDGVDGFLIKNRNIEAFADKVCQLIEDEDLRRRMGQNGIMSSQRYRADVIMPKWVCLFEELTSGQ